MMAWNEALNQGTAVGLARFYSAQVLFYGKRMTATGVVAAKRKALESAPDFKQQVSDIHINKAPGGFVLKFDKRCGPKLDSVVTGRLVLEAMGSQLSIIEESDSVTDLRFKESPPATCGEAVGRVLRSHPVIQKDRVRVAREMPYFTPGGVIYEETPHRLNASQGYFSEDRYDPRWWIDASGGTLTIRDALIGELLAVNNEQKAMIRALCTEVTPDAGQ